MANCYLLYTYSGLVNTVAFNVIEDDTWDEGWSSMVGFRALLRFSCLHNLWRVREALVW